MQFLAPLLLIGALSALTYRLVLTRDSLSSSAPEGTVSAVRIIKTAHSTEAIETHFGNTVLLENSPWTLQNVLAWSKREVVIFMDNNTVIGVAVDQELPSEIQTGITTLELPIFTKQDQKFPRMNPWLILPWYEGEIITFKPNKSSAPLRFAKDGLIVNGRTSVPKTLPVMSVPENTTPYALISVSPEEIAAFGGFDVPLVYSGTKSFFEEAKERGMIIFFGEDDHGFLYNFSIKGGVLSVDDLKSLVSELFYAPTISEVSFESDAINFEELRAKNKVQINSTEQNDVIIVSARDGAGNVIRVTQTPHYLIVTNRDINLEGMPLSSSSCLNRAREFVMPETLVSLLPPSAVVHSSTPLALIFESREIAFTKNRTKLCW